MATTTNTGLNQPVYNSTSPTWDQPLNFNETILDAVFGNTTSIAMPTGASATTTLTGPTSSGSLGQTQAMRITLTGALSANQILQFPSGISGKWIIYNTTSGSFSITVSSAGGGTSVSAPQGYNVSIYSDGTNICYTDDGLTNNFGTLTVLGNTYLATTSGNVGIGTSSPSQKLVVNAASGAAVSLVQATTSNTAWFSLLGNGSTFLSGDFNFYHDGTQAGIRMAASLPMTFATANTERMRITSAGAVGIGTTTVTSGGLLAVNGNTPSVGKIMAVADTGGISLALTDATAGTNGSLYVKHQNPVTIFTDATQKLAFAAGSTTPQMVLDTSGNVGIGTSSPTAKLHVLGNNGTNGTSAFFSISSSNSGIAMVNNGTIGGIQGQTTPTGTNTDIYINANGGNVGIGTTSPSKKLEVFATANSLQIESIVRNDQAGSGVASIGFNVSSSAASETTSTKAGIGLVRQTSYGVGSLVFYNNGTTSAGDFTTSDERMRIDSSGNLLVGTTTASTILTVNGTVTATSFTGAGTGLTGTASSLTAGNVNGIVAVANGGTGLSSTPANGAIDIGNGTNFTRSTITAGSGITVTNGTGSITIAATATAATGTLIRAPQVLTSGTSYTTPAGCNSIYVEVVGGGGGGGGNNNVLSGGGGGGGGGYAAKYFTVSPSTAYSYAIGGAGSCVNASNGNSGGSTTFTVSATTITASGGSGGIGGSSGTEPKQGGAGGSGSSGDLNGGGSAGSNSVPSVAATGVCGTGGGSYFGGGGLGGFGATGNPGTGYGGGGGGNCGGTSGVGKQGVIRIWEYT